MVAVVYPCGHPAEIDEVFQRANLIADQRSNVHDLLKTPGKALKATNLVLVEDEPATVVSYLVISRLTPAESETCFGI